MTLSPQPCLGIDPGLNRCGYAVLVRSPRGPILKEGGVIRTSPKQSLAERVLEIGRELRAIIEEFQPAAMAIEQVFSLGKNPKSAILMAHARGVILFAAADRDVPVHHYTPKQIKRLLTGSGNADKSQVQRVVARELSLDAVPEPHDVADACAIALCHLYSTKVDGR
ncbi:MAG: crossover junction endodeoxyribonuclease RuvC [Planctomycetaceae bacterium]|nr:crossover junction endodeoxyribonuclease RuvC [Planctomycetaceae bacterium]